jgi:hypothetical protein
MTDAKPKFFHITGIDYFGQATYFSGGYESFQRAIGPALDSGTKRIEIRVTQNEKAVPGEGELVWEKERQMTRLETLDFWARKSRSN